MKAITRGHCSKGKAEKDHLAETGQVLLKRNRLRTMKALKMTTYTLQPLKLEHRSSMSSWCAMRNSSTMSQ
jgi:hypothetical protein